MSHQTPNEGSDRSRFIITIPEGASSLAAINDALNRSHKPSGMDYMFVRTIDLASRKYTMDDYNFLANDIRKVRTFLYNQPNGQFTQTAMAITQYLRTQVQFLEQMKSIVFKQTDQYTMSRLTPSEITARADDGVTRVMRKVRDATDTGLEENGSI